MTAATALTEFTRTTLSNGLRVVVAPDESSDVVAVAVVYDVGFRSEPEGLTGFAHLFEHLMFQGSANVGKVEHIAGVEGAGGVMNGHTQSDITAYYEALPRDGLELVLWLEADRMARLNLTEENLRNQVSVVKEEIKVNVLNRPYGGFPWLTLPPVAFDTYPNAHNGYGDFAHLEHATLDDAAAFYERHYAPSNAVLAVAGGCTTDQVFELAEKHFGALPTRRKPTLKAFGEPPLRRERHRSVPDRFIPLPAFVAGYRVPDPVAATADYVSYAVLAKVLTDGDASRLRLRLVHHDRLATDVGCILGVFGSDAFTIRDPVLFQVLVFHTGTMGTNGILGIVDDELTRIAQDGPAEEELVRVAAATTADYWRGLDAVLPRALALAGTESIHGRAELVAELPGLIESVQPDDVAAAARALLDQHRAIVELRPKADA